jgi:DNA-binding transcriptional regulator YiaG
VTAVETRNRQVLANLISELRQRLGLSQEKLASKLGVSYQSVNRWENNRAVPSQMALKLIEAMLLKMGDRGADLLNRYFPEEV